MKLNESKEMWVCVSPSGVVNSCSLAHSENDSKDYLEESQLNKWWRLMQLGWQCIPVNVLVTPKEISNG